MPDCACTLPLRFYRSVSDIPGCTCTLLNAIVIDTSSSTTKSTLGSTCTPTFMASKLTPLLQDRGTSCTFTDRRPGQIFGEGTTC